MSTDSSLLDSIQNKLQAQGFDHRPGQVTMMEAVYRSFSEKTVAVIEGGTGIGKSFAYLLPLLEALPEKTTLVVATATVNLQEQLLLKDKPIIEKILDTTINAAIAKGRGRYFCPNKAERSLGSDQNMLDLFGLDASDRIKKDDKNQEIIERMCADFDTERFDGDLDSWANGVSGALKAQVTIDSNACTHRRCSYFQQCPYFRAKRSLAKADLIITNHDLLLSDISMGTGALLPPAEQCFYVIDEAHHFPEKAIGHFSGTLLLKGAQSWCDSGLKWLNKAASLADWPPGPVDRLQEIWREWSEYLHTLSEEAKGTFEDLEEKDFRLLDALPEAWLSTVEMFKNSAPKAVAALSSLSEDLKTRFDPKTLPEFEGIGSALGFYIQRCHSFGRTWQLLTTFPEDGPPIAKWLVKRKTDAKVDIQLNAAMITAGSILPEFFWSKLTHGAVLCSATLRAVGSFDRFLEHSGLLHVDGVHTHTCLSPFPYEASYLQLPDMVHAPEKMEQDDFIEEVAQKLPDLFKQNEGGVLVLFTSKSMMNDVLFQLPKSLNRQILVQGEKSRTALIDQHKSNIEQGKTSILFGLQSFAEGLDLPGDYCTHLIITKLPFSVPTTPTEQTRSQWLTEQGRKPFMEQSLPEASIRLTQYAGRLIRDENDRGILTILDPRLQTKFYGSILLNNLPPFSRTPRQTGN